MKKTLLFCMALCLAAMHFSSCQKGASRIHGTISSQYNDKRIFLVPLYGPKTAEYVDSVEISDGKFEFATDTLMIAQIVVDYHYRMGIEPLLVVTEPGDIKVEIGQVSHATGTPQNDSLEKWKLATQDYQDQIVRLRRDSKHQEAEQLQQEYKLLTRTMAEQCQGTLLGEFLANRFPKTYKRQYPDGREVTIDADTHEEITE
jgi:hypothetical protein